MARACILYGPKCSNEGRAVEGTSRCTNHGTGTTKHRNPEYDGHHQELRAKVVKPDSVCWICGEGPRPTDPMQADHVIPLSMGGRTELANMKPAHRSCNVAKGGANRKRNLK